MAAEFNEDNFEAEVIGSSTPVLVDFWSEGCPPCRELSPVIDELSAESAGTAKVGKINVTENMELAIKYGVAAVPTILVFKGGEVVARQVGAVPKTKLQEMLAV